MKKEDKSDKNKDWYAVLQVNPRACPEVIDAAYKALMKLHHPDKGGDKNRAEEINDARAVLMNSSKRAEYDTLRNNLKGKVIGNYRILEFIAEGGFGETYKAKHILADELVCFKHCSNISPEDEAILLAEAKAIWDLRHYALPVMRDFVRMDDGSFSLVMSYIPGPTLAQVVEKAGRLDAEDVAWIAERILNSLKYLHYHGVVHGDVKPQNIIIQPESHLVVLVDFGLSMVKPSSKDVSKGYTLLFAPPEEIDGGSPLIPESDFYSLGMTMIYALGGNAECVKKKMIPDTVPDPLANFIKRLIVRGALSRPNWEKEDLFETIQRVRQESFGRSRSNMKPLKGF